MLFCFWIKWAKLKYKLTLYDLAFQGDKSGGGARFNAVGNDDGWNGSGSGGGVGVGSSVTMNSGGGDEEWGLNVYTALIYQPGFIIKVRIALFRSSRFNDGYDC